MEVRIAILDQNDKPIGFLDNTLERAYEADSFVTYLQGGACTIQLRAYKTDGIEAGNKLAFHYEDKDYYLTITKVTETDYYKELNATGLTFELINEQCRDYRPEVPKGIKDYLSFAGQEQAFTFGICEVSQTIQKEMTGNETLLSRLYKIAEMFDAELEFEAVLNPNYSLKEIKLNIYKAHDDSHQGIGRNRTGEIVRYGTFKSIRKVVDSAGLYTALIPKGNSDLTVAAKHGLRDSGLVVDGDCIYYPAARTAYPAMAKPNGADSSFHLGGRYILGFKTYDTDNVDELYRMAKKDLLADSKPKATFEIEGYLPGNIGDTFTIEDKNQYFQCRIVEQEISFTDPSKNKTKFDNFTQVSSKISSTTQAIVQKMINESTPYEVLFVSDNGVVLKDGERTTIQAYVRKNGQDAKFLTYRWYKGNTQVSTSASVTVTYAQAGLYTFKAYQSDGKEVAKAQLTVTGIQDGVSQYIHIRYSDYPRPLDAQMQTEPAKYIGIAITEGTVAPVHASDYSWSKFTGDDGMQGADGSSIIFADTTIRSGTREYWDGVKLTDQTWTEVGNASSYRIGDIAVICGVITDLADLGCQYYGKVVGIADRTLTTAYKSFVQDGVGGTSVQSIAHWYYLSDSADELTGGSWTQSMPPYQDGKTLWTKDEVTYTSPSGTNTQSTVPVLETSWQAARAAYQDAVDQLANAVNDTTTQFKELDDKLTTLVQTKYYDSESMDAKLGEIYTSIEESSREIQMTFQTIEPIVREALGPDGSVTVELAEIKSYIRFENGNIILGKQGSPLTLTIQNDRISYSQSGKEVAYFADRKLYVLEAEFPNGLKLGNFGFELFADGSLGFRKVK